MEDQSESCLDQLRDSGYRTRNILVYIIQPLVFTSINGALMRKYGANFVSYYKYSIIILNVIIVMKCIETLYGLFYFYESDTKNEK